MQSYQTEFSNIPFGQQQTSPSFTFPAAWWRYSGTGPGWSSQAAPAVTELQLLPLLLLNPHLLGAGREDPGGRLAVEADLEEFLPTEEAVSVEVKLVESSLNLPEPLLGSAPVRGGSFLRPNTAKEPEVLLGSRAQSFLSIISWKLASSAHIPISWSVTIFHEEEMCKKLVGAQFGFSFTFNIWPRPSPNPQPQPFI